MVFPGLVVAISLLVAGAIVGTISGMVGIGGGILVIPILMIGFGFSQAKANGTSMAMLLPPIGLFAVMSYWRAGNVDIAYSLLLAIGFAGGAYVGAAAVNSGSVNSTALRAMFAVLLLYVACRMLFRPGGHGRAAIEASLVLIGFGISHLLLRHGRKRIKQSERISESIKRFEMTDTYDYEI
jgi:uncharacterized membrane protein YfcA